MFITLFGTIGVGADRSVVAPIESAVARAVIAVLAIAPRHAVSLDTLADRIWDVPPPSARNAIQVAVSRLRTRFGADIIETVPTGYRLGNSLAQIDVLDVEAALSEVHARVASDQWGDALSSAEEVLPLTDHASFAGLESEWAASERRRVDDLVMDLRALRASALLNLGRAEEADLEFASLQAERPLDERMTVGRMRALSVLRRQPQAVAEYHRLRRRLRHDLGMDPSPEAEAALLLALGERPPLQRRQTHAVRLPILTGPTWGRDDDCQAIVTPLLEGHRLVSITGIGGVGKTRLAVLVGKRIAAEGVSSVWFVDLATVSTEADLQSALGATVDPGGSDWQGVLSDGAHLVILDNVERAIDGVVGMLDALLEQEGVQLLVTSRRSLAVTGERVVRLGPLSTVGDHSPATQMLTALAGVSVDAAGGSAPVDMLARFVDGVPLALELVAAGLQWHSAEELVQELETLSEPSGAPTQYAAARADVATVIGWSIANAPRRSRAALASLLRCRGTFSLSAAEAILRAVQPAEEPRDLLAGLLDHSLIHRLPGAGEPRLRILEPVRLIAAQHPQVGSWDATAGDAFAEFFLATVRSVVAALAETEVPLIRLHVHDSHHIPAALEWAWQRGTERGAAALGDVLYFWYATCQEEPFRQWATVSADEGFDSASGAVRALSIYTWAINDGRAEDVEELRDVILRHVDDLPDDWRMRWVKTEADRLRRSGDVAAAVAVRAAGPPLRSRRDRASQALFDALVDLSESAFDRAGCRLDKVLDERLTAEMPVFHLFVLSTRGYLCTMLGEFERADVMLTQASAIAASTGVRFDFVQVANARSWLQLERGSPSEALTTAAASAEALGSSRDVEYMAEIALVIALAAEALEVPTVCERAVGLLLALTDSGQSSPFDAWQQPQADALLARWPDVSASPMEVGDLATHALGAATEG